MVKFISYDGKFPNLCSGTLVLENNGKQYRLRYRLVSGGCVRLNSGFGDQVTKGPWTVDCLPKELKPYHAEIEKLVNEHVPQGCCGGCI